MSENMNNMNENFDNAVSGVEIIPKKKKGKKIAVISGITALVIVGGGAVSYGVSDFVKNQVNLRIMKPEKYYAWVTEENSKNFAQTAKEKYQKNLDRISKGQKMSVTLGYVPTDDAKDFALNEILGEDYRNTTSGEEKTLIDIVDNINNISFGSQGNFSKDGSSSGNIFMSLNGEDIINGDFAVDNSAMEYFFRIPELNEQWLCMSMASYFDEVNDMLDTNFNDIMKNPSDYLSPEELEDIIIRYTDVWNKSVEDIEIEKKESIDICDITVDYTVVSAELTEQDCYNLCINLFDEMKNDSIIKRLCVEDFGVCTEDEYVSEFEDMITELEETELSNTGETLNVDTYIDPSGDIRGLRVYMEDEMDVFCALGKDGDNIRGEFYVSDGDDDKVFGVELYADESNGSYSGNIDFTDYDSYDYETGETTEKTFSVEFADYAVTNEDMGYVKGNISLIIPDESPISFEFVSDGNSQGVKYDINIDGTDYGTLSLDIAVNEGAEFAIPSSDGAFCVEYSDDMSDVDIESYVSQESIQNYLHDILVKIGFGEELSAEGAEIFAGSLYGIDTDWDAMDDEDYYDDFDIDFNFDFDDEDEDDDDDIEWGVWQTDEGTEVIPADTEEVTEEKFQGVYDFTVNDAPDNKIKQTEE
ncbi:MAG: hypothetical protein K2J08_07090 [Ruminococcus sp.]|nr:hypothetical protein [Ruminococcus sp.]